MKTELFLRETDLGVQIWRISSADRMFYLLDTHIEGAKRDLATIMMLSVPNAKLLDTRFGYILDRRPARLSDLEDAILNFVSKDLNCRPSEIRRDANGKERQQYFDADLKRIEDLFEEADRINGERRILI